MAQKLADFGTYGLHIIRFPSGRYGFVGTIPVALAQATSYPTEEAATAAFNTWRAANAALERMSA